MLKKILKVFNQREKICFAHKRFNHTKLDLEIKTHNIKIEILRKKIIFLNE
jgi:hypothetical protein